MSIAPETLALESVYRWERERADEIFLTQPFGGGKVRHWTWAQAAGEARRIASYLQAQGWEPGTRIGILSKNSAWWIMADLAIWMSGHVSVPVYPSLRPQHARQILEHSGAKACFLGAVDEREASAIDVLPDLHCISLPNSHGRCDLDWETLVTANSPIAGNPQRGADELATIIYTSGTTGTPKGVMHRFGSFAFDARVLTALLDIREEQRFFSYLPLAHIVERAGMECIAFRLGCRVFFTEGIETFLEDLHRARPTIFLSVPRLLLKFQQNVYLKIPKEKLDMLMRIPAVSFLLKRRILHGLGLNTVRHAACGAAPLPPEILMWYRSLGLDLAEGYGMTETMITHLPRPGSVRPGYVGPPLEGVEQRLGNGGELQIRSPMNMMGYYRDEKGTHEAFTEDGYFRTGDAAEIDADGQLKIIGRLKEQFKTSKGKYVTPSPIEARLMEHPVVEACCLMGAGYPSPFAIVILAEAVRERCVDPQERRAVEESLQNRLQQINAELDPFERLSMIVIADGPWTIGNGLMTPTLKIRRRMVEDQYQGLIDGWAAQDQVVVWQSIPQLQHAPQAQRVSEQLSQTDQT